MDKASEIVFESVPKQLAEKPQWVTWKIEIRNGKKTKVPYNPNYPGMKAEADDPNTWATLSKAIEESRRNGFQGIGFEFSKDDQIVGIDLDQAVNPENGELDQWAQKIVDSFNSYTEVSPSGTGVHIFCRGEKPSDKCRTGIPESWNGQPEAHVELYNNKRFFTFTGERMARTPFKLTDGTEALQKLFLELWSEVPKPKTKPLSHNISGGISDQELLDRIQKSKQASKFFSLWTGDLSEYPSQSEGDLALCCLLAFWTGRDTTQMDSLFRKSALMRDKWDQRHGSCTYGESTIQEAIEFTKNVFSPGKQKRKSLPVDTEPPITEPGKPRFFNDENKFVSLWLAKHIASRRTLCFGYDSENGSGRLMEYLGGVWRVAVGLDWDAHELLRTRRSKNRISETLSALQCEVPKIPWTDFNQNRDLINCRSGMLNLFTGGIEPHKREYYSTFQIPVEYNPNVSCDIVETFLAGVLPEDAVALAKQMMGYILITCLKAYKFFILEGVAGTGKTTFLDAFIGMLGDNNWAQVTLQDLAENRFAPAKLENKLLGCFDDLDNQALRSVSKIKAMTGGFPWLDIERKCENAYRAPLYARLMFTCNEIPTGPDKSNAWYDRFSILSFKNVFRGTDKDDRNLAEKLATEDARQKLFAMAVSGLKTLAENEWRFPEPATSNDELKLYEQCNNSIRAFIDECCELEKGAKTYRTKIKEEYASYCQNNHLKEESSHSLYKYLRETLHCLDNKDEKGGRCFSGIQITEFQQSKMFSSE